VLDIPVKVIDVHLHLSKVLMGELTDFQVNQHVAVQQAIVEHEVNEEVIFIKGEAFLSGLEKEAFSQFQEKVLQFVDDSGFKIGLGVFCLFVEPQKLQHVRLFQQISRLGDDLPLFCQPPYLIFIPTQRQPFIQACVELALEFGQRPIVLK